MKKGTLLAGFNVETGLMIRARVIRENKTFIKVSHIDKDGNSHGEYKLTPIEHSDRNYKYDRTGNVYEVVKFDEDDKVFNEVFNKNKCKRALNRIKNYKEKIRTRQEDIAKLNAEISEIEELIKTNQIEIKNTEELNGKN